MLKNKKTLTSELLSNRNNTITKVALLEQIDTILKENQIERDNTLKTISEESSTKSNAFVFDTLETDCIFHISQIRTICIDYRLRFLETNFFKGGIPEEAISKIQALEKIHQTKLNGFKIMAPSKVFQLLSYDDPLLFAPIGNDYYYLVHKWGNDISPIRKWLVKPFRDLNNFVWFCLMISILLTALTPENNLSKSIPMASIIIFLFMFKSIVAVFMYAFFMMGKNFNVAIWDRKYFNN